MGFVCRLVGWVLLLASLALLAADAIASAGQGAPHFIAVGELWNNLHRDSLLLAEPAIDRHVWPGLWQNVVVPVLLWPAFAVLMVPGFLLLLAFRRRRRYGLRG